MRREQQTQSKRQEKIVRIYINIGRPRLAHTSFWLRNYSINGQRMALCASSQSLPPSPSLYHFIAYLMPFFSLSSLFVVVHRLEGGRHRMPTIDYGIAIVSFNLYWLRWRVRLARIHHAIIIPISLMRTCHYRIIRRNRWRKQCTADGSASHWGCSSDDVFFVSFVLRSAHSNSNMNEKCSLVRRDATCLEIVTSFALVCAVRIVVWRVRAILFVRSPADLK